MRILITGARDWPGGCGLGAWVIRAAIVGALGRDRILTGAVATIVHGGARGADTIAAEAAASFGYAVEAHPISSAEWAEQGKGAGHRRNRRMVDLGADVCIAFPTNASRGTWDCVRRARRAGIPTRIYLLPGDHAARGQALAELRIARPGSCAVFEADEFARFRPVTP